MMHLPAGAVRASILALATIGLAPLVSLAGVTFSSGTASLIHIPDLINPTQGVFTLSGVVRSSAVVPSPPSYSLNRSYVVGSNTLSIARGTVGHVSNSTTATVVISSGTGVTQSDPLNQLAGASALRINLNNLIWTATSPSFGPTATGFFSLRVGGSNSVGGNSRVQGQIEFRDAITNALLRSPFSFDRTYSSSGAFSDTITTSAVLGGGSLPTNTQVRLGGFLQFQTLAGPGAFSEGTPASTVFLDELEVGSTFPTWTYVNSNNPNLQQWNDPSRWLPDPLAAGLGAIPNGPGHRARFRLDNAGQDRNVRLPNQSITLAGMDLLTSSRTNISSGINDNSVMVFNSGVPTEPAVIKHQRLEGGDLATLIFEPRVRFDSSLVLDIDTADPVGSGGFVFRSGLQNSAPPGGPPFIRKQGVGLVRVQQPSSGQGIVAGQFVCAEGTTLFESWVLSLDVIAQETGEIIFFHTSTRLDALSLHDESRVSIQGGSALVTEVLDTGLSPSTDAQLDLHSSGLVVDYPTGGPSPLQPLVTRVIQGRNSGTWDGNGITSTLIDPTREAVGIAEAAAIGASLFLNQSVDGTSVLMRRTLLGDADLNATVNISDFARLAGKFNQLGGWSDGDFDYNGLVGIGDFSLLAANFNLSLPSGSPAFSTVPEPVSVLPVLAALAIRRRTLSR